MIRSPNYSRDGANNFCFSFPQQDSLTGSYKLRVVLEFE